jgi:acid stress-induced BolA-like protein IbaG/YrbA
METVDKIKALIESAIPGSVAYVENPGNDGAHFEAIVVSAEFEKISLFKQHQKVMQCLKAEFEGSVHAMRLKTFSPAAWEENNKGKNL